MTRFRILLLLALVTLLVLAYGGLPGAEALEEGPGLTGEERSRATPPLVEPADFQAKLSPALQQRLAQADGSEPLELLVTVQAGHDLSRYLQPLLVRPYVDSLSRQMALGTAPAGLVALLAADPAVSAVRLAAPVQPPAWEELLLKDSTAAAEEIAARVQLVAGQESNARAVPAADDRDPDGWWDIGEGHHSAEAWANGFTGEGVKVLVNDSGIDFCHPDLMGTWAVISDTNSPYDGWPQMFDSYSMFLYAQDVRQGTDNVASGLADYADTSATCSLGSCSYQPIGAAGAYTFTLPAASQSGVYHIGSHPDTRLAQIYGERVAVLVVDENTAGVYDHVYVDLDHDYDFSDEVPADKEMPVACLDYYDGLNNVPGADGYNDLSGGLVYFISDGSRYIPASDWLWNGLVPDNGDLVAFIIIDSRQSGGAHGQWVASNVAAQGIINGDAPPVKAPYSGPGSGMVAGGGLDARLVANGNFYQSLFLDEGFLFSARGYDGLVGTADDIQLNTNSWADSSVHNEGWDEDSRIIEQVLRLNPALTAIFSTGNGGAGYGTRVGPLPPSAMGVGSSTQFGSLGIFDSISTTSQIVWGDVAPFSNRGPDAGGGNGIEVTANGAVGSGDHALNQVGDGWQAWIGWIGTSRSVPVAAGNMALVYDAYRQEHGVWPDSETAQAILMAGAENQSHDTLVQGAGSVDALQATNIAGGLGGFYSLPSQWAAGGYRGANFPGFSSIIFPGQIQAQPFTLTNPGPAAVTVTVSAEQLRRSSRTSFTFTSTNVISEDTSTVKRPDYLLELTELIPAGTDLMVVQLVYPYDQLDPDSNYSSNQRWELQLLNWTDLNGNQDLWVDANLDGVVNTAEIDAYEYIRFAYDYATSNSMEVRLGRPLERMADGLFLGLRHIQRSGAVPTTTFTIQLDFYQYQPWDWVVVPPAVVTVPAGGSAQFEAVMAVPEAAEYGLHNGLLRLSSPQQESIIPLVANVAVNGQEAVLGGSPEADTPYDNGRVRGHFNWSWRPESGDWRHFFLNAAPEPGAQTSLVIHDEWPGPWPGDIDTRIFGPSGDSYSRFDPEYYGPYTLGPVGGSVDTNMGGGVYTFQTATGGSAEWVSAPLRPGLHLIAQHNVLYAGPETSLPFTKTVGTVSLAQAPFVDLACEISGTLPVTLSNSIELADLTADAYGLGMTEVYTGLLVGQDDPMDPSTAGYTQTLTVADGGRIAVGLTGGGPPPTDLHLYLLQDRDNSGTFEWPGEVVAAGITPGPDATLQLDQPPDGDYLIAVHGYNVSAPPALFSLAVTVIEGSNVSLGGLPGGVIPAGSETVLEISWSQNVGPGELWQGLLFLHTPLLPELMTVPLYVLPCDGGGYLPQAEFSHSGPAIPGETVVFSNTSGGQAPLSYSWDFGDGQGSSTEAEPTYVYDAPGMYTVTLTVSNFLGSDSAEMSILIGLPAQAGFLHSGPVVVGETVMFTNTSSGTAPLSYSWDFGDGGGSSAENPVHLYTQSGAYTVTLTTSNLFGSSMWTEVVVVEPARVYMPVVWREE